MQLRYMTYDSQTETTAGYPRRIVIGAYAVKPIEYALPVNLRNPRATVLYAETNLVSGLFYTDDNISTFGSVLIGVS